MENILISCLSKKWNGTKTIGIERKNRKKKIGVDETLRQKA